MPSRTAISSCNIVNRNTSYERPRMTSLLRIVAMASKRPARTKNCNDIAHDTSRDNVGSIESGLNRLMTARLLDGSERKARYVLSHWLSPIELFEKILNP